MEQIQFPGLPDKSASRQGTQSVDSVVRKGNCIHCVTNSTPIRTQNTVSGCRQQHVLSNGDSERPIQDASAAATTCLWYGHQGQVWLSWVHQLCFENSRCPCQQSLDAVVSRELQFAQLRLTEHHLSIPAVIIEVKPSCKKSSLCFLNVPLYTIHCHGMVF